MSESNNFDPLLEDPADRERQQSPFERLSSQKRRIVLYGIPLLAILGLLANVVYNAAFKLTDEEYYGTQTAESSARMEQAVIRIVEPKDGMMRNAGTQNFTWDWLRPLNTGDEFVLRVDGREAGRIGQSNNTFYRIDLDTADWVAGSYVWDVSLENGGIPVDTIAPVSATLLITTFIKPSTPTVPAPNTPTPLATAAP